MDRACPPVSRTSWPRILCAGLAFTIGMIWFSTIFPWTHRELSPSFAWVAKWWIVAGAIWTLTLGAAMRALEYFQSRRATQ